MVAFEQLDAVWVLMHWRGELLHHCDLLDNGFHDIEPIAGAIFLLDHLQTVANEVANGRSWRAIFKLKVS